MWFVAVEFNDITEADMVDFYLGEEMDQEKREFILAQSHDPRSEMNKILAECREPSALQKCA